MSFESMLDQDPKTFRVSNIADNVCEVLAFLIFLLVMGSKSWPLNKVTPSSGEWFFPL
jgi:hypothetical protein